LWSLSTREAAIGGCPTSLPMDLNVPHVENNSVSPCLPVKSELLVFCSTQNTSSRGPTIPRTRTTRPSVSAMTAPWRSVRNG
jgi:hypothetical protein